MTKKVSTKKRRAVAERANGCCEYCLSQAQFVPQSFSVEHIVPVSKSGESDLKNLALACQGCNNHKYNKTEAEDPISGKIILLFHPREQSWHKHFVWNDDYSTIIGTTTTGRATVQALRLNRESLVNLRKVLYEAGKHPPSA